jgi:hypothetical protein
LTLAKNQSNNTKLAGLNQFPMSYFADWNDLKALVHIFKFPVRFDWGGRGVMENININAPISALFLSLGLQIRGASFRFMFKIHLYLY